MLRVDAERDADGDDVQDGSREAELHDVPLRVCSAVAMVGVHADESDRDAEGDTVPEEPRDTVPHADAAGVFDAAMDETTALRVSEPLGVYVRVVDGDTVVEEQRVGDAELDTALDADGAREAVEALLGKTVALKHADEDVDCLVDCDALGGLEALGSPDGDMESVMGEQTEAPARL